MSQQEINENQTIETESNFYEIAISFLEDNRLTSEEKSEINYLVSSYKAECNIVLSECKDHIKEIKDEIELKNIIGNSQDYKETVEEISKLNTNEIKNIQHILGTSIDGVFGIESYIAYKNSSISGVFDPKDISKGRRVGENIKGFIDSFTKLNGVDSEIMAIILSENISSNSFIFLDDNGNITVLDKNDYEQELITFSEAVSFEGLLHNSFSKRDISIINKQLDLISKDSDKKNYISTLKNIIEKYNYQREARQTFTKTTSKGVEISLTNSSLNKEIKAVDLFGDYKELTIGGEKYVNNDGEFINIINGKRLAIFNKQVLDIKEFSRNERKNEVLGSNTKKEINEAKENVETELTKDFGDWLTKDGVKQLGRTGKNSCGTAVHQLVNTFMRSKGVMNALNINTGRNGANFDSILEAGNISIDNPFIGASGTKISSKEKLLKNGIDISKTINKNLVINHRNIDFPKDAIAGEILVFNEGAESKKASVSRQKYGHVEIKGSDNMYYSYYKSKIPGGSTSISENIEASEYKRLTGFNGKAYSIEMKT